MATDKPKREIISPEGVEERVEIETTFRLTLTGGGKFRAYMDTDGHLSTVGVYATKDEATKQLGAVMLTMGGMHLDPKRTLAAIFENLQNLPKKEPRG